MFEWCAHSLYWWCNVWVVCLFTVLMVQCLSDTANLLLYQWCNVWVMCVFTVLMVQYWVVCSFTVLFQMQPNFSMPLYHSAGKTSWRCSKFKTEFVAFENNPLRNEQSNVKLFVCLSNSNWNDFVSICRLVYNHHPSIVYMNPCHTKQAYIYSKVINLNKWLSRPMTNENFQKWMGPKSLIFNAII